MNVKKSPQLRIDTNVNYDLKTSPSEIPSILKNSSVDFNEIKKPKVLIKENDFYFDKSLKENIKFPKGYFKIKRE